MKTLSCLIVDDEPLAVKMLESFVTRTPGLELAASYTDSVEAFSNLKNSKADLLFLDIEMPDIDGMEIARVVPSHTRIIFTTAYKEYAFESYEVSALDFLLKPIRYSKFLSAVEKARQWFDRIPVGEESVAAPEVPSSHDTIFLRVDGEFRQIPFSQILYVSGMKDYVRFYLEGERLPLTTHLTMKAAEDSLPSSQFMRVNRSYIVALQKIRSVDRNGCLYIGDEVIRVTDAYKEAFERYLHQNLS